MLSRGDPLKEAVDDFLVGIAGSTRRLEEAGIKLGEP
jgi:hypothetical protein